MNIEIQMEEKIDEAQDWRTQLQHDHRENVINSILVTLKRHLPFSGQEGVQELKKIAVWIEEKTYTAATSQQDYLQKISLKMLTMETKSQNPMSNPIQPNAASSGQNALGPGSHSMQSQVNSQGQQLPVPMVANQTQTQQSQTTQQYLYQLHHQLMKLKFQQGSTPQNLMQAHLQQPQQPQQEPQHQQQQQNLVQPTQIPASQQALMQSPAMQSTSLSNLQQNQQFSVQQPTQSTLEQRPQSVLRQQQAQQASMLIQQSSLSVQQHQQQQQLIPQAQQSGVANLQQKQMMVQQNTTPDVQQQLPQQRLVGRQNSYNSLLQQQQQQLLNQQNNLQDMHNQLLDSQSNITGVQQQQLTGNQQPGIYGLPSNQHPTHMLQQSKVPVQQQIPQGTTTLLPSLGQQSQSQPSQQQMMSQSQSQLGLLQSPLALQKQTDQSQREVELILRQQNVIEQQKQLFQPQRATPEASSSSLDSTAQMGNANGVDWQEEVYQKIKALREVYLSELTDLLQKIVRKVQQGSLPQHPQHEQIEKLKMFKITLERTVMYLRVNKHEIQPVHEEKLLLVEKNISFFLSSNRPRNKPASAPLQGQILQQPMQFQQRQPLDGQTNPPMLTVQGSIMPRRATKVRSHVWKHFEVEENEKQYRKAVCNHCGSVFHCDSKFMGNTPLIKHLQMCPELDPIRKICKGKPKARNIP